MIPAFSACTESPEPGISTSRTVSAIPITSTSLCPAPTVSRKTMSFPDASRTSSACSVASARPPRCPRVPIERMKTPEIEEVIGEADAISEQRSMGERARRVDGEDADRPLLRAHVTDERGDEAGLADAGRPGHADGVGAARLRIDIAHELGGHRVAVLDERDRPRERPPVARADALRERLARPVPPRPHVYAASASTGRSTVLSTPRASA